MVISTKNKFIFAAYSKTGTTSIENALKIYNNHFMYFYLYLRYRFLLKNTKIFKHIRPMYLQQILGESQWERYFSFSFVRNPWSRSVSLYFSHRRDPTRRKLAQESFTDWVLGGGTGPVRKSMYEFICDADGNVIVDFVGRYENLEQDFARICEQAGLPRFELPHLNQSTSGDYRKHYTSETRDIVAGWSRLDIEKFGYDF
jgi:hypothetical protein